MGVVGGEPARLSGPDIAAQAGPRWDHPLKGKTFFARASRWLGPNTQTPRLAEVGVVQKGIGACYVAEATGQVLKCVRCG